MTPAETRRKAKVMLESLKKGAVVYWRPRYGFLKWEIDHIPVWNWLDCEYKVEFEKKRRKAK